MRLEEMEPVDFLEQEGLLNMFDTEEPKPLNFEEDHEFADLNSDDFYPDLDAVDPCEKPESVISFGEHMLLKEFREGDIPSIPLSKNFSIGSLSNINHEELRELLMNQFPTFSDINLSTAPEL